MKALGIFFLGLVLGAVGILFWTASNEQKYMTFPQKGFINFGDGFQLRGSLVGEGKNKPINGYMKITCERGESFCDLISIDQIGPKQLGDFWQELLRVEEWTDTTVRLSSRLRPDAPVEACNYYEIRVNLADETATYTRIPSPTFDDDCKEFYGSNGETLQWRIDDGYRWQEMRGRHSSD